jgi:hypothetical protein
MKKYDKGKKAKTNQLDENDNKVVVNLRIPLDEKKKRR